MGGVCVIDLAEISAENDAKELLVHAYIIGRTSKQDQIEREVSL